MRVDAHQHFWTLRRGDYSWPTADLEPLYRDFAPSDLEPELTAARIDATVLVQAAPTAAETDFLLGLAARHPFVRSVVGWVDLAAGDAPDRIGALACDPLFGGLRPMVQGMADDRWMLRGDLAPAYDSIIAHGLTFDALILPRHLPVLAELLESRPALRVVIDHGAKPPIAGGGFEDWADGIARVAAAGAWCKVSGLWTEAAGATDDATIGRYVDHLLECFGPARLMWGSDWPVIRLAGDYGDWLAQCERMMARLAPPEREAVFGGNAGRFYGFE